MATEAPAASSTCAATGSPSRAASIPTRAPPASMSRIRSRLNISATPEHDGERPARPPTRAPEPVDELLHARTLAGARLRNRALQPARCRVCRRAVQRPSAWSTTSGMPKVADRFAAVSTLVEQAGGDHPPLAQQQRVGEARAGSPRRGGRPAPWPARRGRSASRDSVETRSSRPPRSSPAAGSSSSSSSGSVISARAIWTRLRSPSLRVPKVRSARRGHAELDEQRLRPGRGRARRTPRASGPTTPYDAETTTSRTALVARDPLGHRGAGQADPRPQLEDVDRAENLVEDPDHPGRRVDGGGGHLEQRGLAGAVGPEDHPALVLLDRPGDRVEQQWPPRAGR